MAGCDFECVHVPCDGNLTRTQWNVLKSSDTATISVNGLSLTLAQPWDAYAGLTKVERNWYEAFCTQYTMNPYLYERFLQSDNTWSTYTPPLNHTFPFADSFHLTLSPPHPSETMMLSEVQVIHGDNQVWGNPQLWWDSFDDANELRTHVQYRRDAPPTIGHYSSHNFRATHRGKGSFLYFDLHVDLRDPVDLAPKGMKLSNELAPNAFFAAY